MVEKICFVGAGSMAESIIAGILKNGFLTSNQICVMNKNDRERLVRLQNSYDICATTDKKEAIEQADIIVLATKPYDIGDAIDSIRTFVRTDQLVISVVAGISTGFILDRIGKQVSVVRTMPNTSASIGFSATAITAGDNVSQDNLEIADKLFQTIGQTTIVKEQDMHVVTGISGSGPAYIYFLVEAMEEAASDAGLDRDVATALIAQTVLGAGEMLKNSGEPANELRRKITSPGGTTQAAIETLINNDFQEVVKKCVRSAMERSVELGKEK